MSISYTYSYIYIAYDSYEIYEWSIDVYMYLITRYYLLLETYE